MSVFKVKLTQGFGPAAQGALDTAVVDGASIQRTIYAPGPNKINRILFDGQTFTDVNYWKRFTYPTLPYDQAFIEVVTDDGSVWNDYNTSDNTFPESVDKTLAIASTYATENNIIDVLGDYGGPAVFTQITNLTASTLIYARINGTAVIPIVGGTSQVFDRGDLSITLIEFDNSASGAVSTSVNVFMSIQSQPTS